MTLRLPRIDLLLLGCAAALTVLLGAEWRAGLQLRQRLTHLPLQQASPPPLAALPPFSLQPPAFYAAIDDRPLFVASRRPAPPPDAAPPRRLALTGIMSTPGGSEVTLLDLDSKQSLRIRSGQAAVEGLTLLSTTPSSATLREGSTSVTLDLVVAPSANLANAPRLPQAPGRAAAPAPAPLATPAPVTTPAPLTTPAPPHAAAAGPKASASRPPSAPAKPHAR